MVAHILQCQLPPIVGYIWMKTIRDIVVRSDFANENKLEQQVYGHFKCHSCSVCNISQRIHFGALPVEL